MTEYKNRTSIAKIPVGTKLTIIDKSGVKYPDWDKPSKLYKVNSTGFTVVRFNGDKSHFTYPLNSKVIATEDGFRIEWEPFMNGSSMGLYFMQYKVR